ncbi:MAG: hypothetical protein FJW14_03210 [Acidimicrobiia bacterium]|nr:hypothetical protein [Acidimicrobiia bacterium]
MRDRFRSALFAVTTLLTALLTAAAVSAHHSVAGQFDTSKSLTLTGVISRVEWINPHIYLHMDVKDQRGDVTTWTLASLPTAMLRRAGLSRESIQGQPGELITVAANPARDETRNLAWITKMTYADGRAIFLTGQ